jgi:hypothetical protein
VTSAALVASATPAQSAGSKAIGAASSRGIAWKYPAYDVVSAPRSLPTASVRKICPSSAHTVFSAPGPPWRSRLTTVPTTTAPAPRATRLIVGRVDGAGKVAGRAVSVIGGCPQTYGRKTGFTGRPTR